MTNIFSFKGVILEISFSLLISISFKRKSSSFLIIYLKGPDFQLRLSNHSFIFNLLARLLISGFIFSKYLLMQSGLIILI